MNPSLLLQKLIEIERSIGIETESTLRRKVLEAQECVLRMQKEQPRTQRPPEVPSVRFALLRAFALRKADGE